MEAFAQSIEGGVVYTWVTSIYWLWPLMETLHFIGLSLLLGGLIVIDTRMAGFFRGVNIAATHKLLPWVFIGFGINLTSAETKTVAWISLLAWTGVLLFGRLIPYVGTG